ncbi:MAG TPA: hypothetical protein VEU62_14170, partial [Bryobacterales bacterium]|nr:hypothetical protein [Bryobacterales bacterium]
MGTAAALLVWSAETAAGDSRERRWLGILLMAQSVSLVTSTLFSADRALSLTGTNWRRFGLAAQLVLLLYTWLLARQSVQHVLRVIAVSGGAAAVYGIAQYFGWDPWLPKQAYHVGEGVWTIVRPPGTLGHADYFGVYLLSVAFAGAALARAERQRFWKCTGAGAAGLAAAAAVLSGTRSALVGLVAGAAALALWLRPRFNRRGAALAAALAMAAVAFYFSPAGLL